MRMTTPAAAVAATLGLLSLNASADTGTLASWAANTKVGGKSYIDFTHIQQKTKGHAVDPTGYGADVKRFYLAIDHTFDEVWSGNLTTDFNYVSGDSETQLFVKKAYLQAKLSDAAVLRAGSADLPWVPYVEDMYGFRYVENTLIDRLKFGTSADWGLHAGGKLADGVLNYAVSAVNGNGYKNPSRSNTVDFSARVGVEPVKGLNVGADYYRGKLGQDTETGPGTRTASRWDAVVAYANPTFRVGAEYFNAQNYKATTNPVLTANPSDEANGYSVWASVNPTERVSLFARYDHAKPNKKTNSSLKDNYYNAGVSYVATKNVDIALVYKYEKVENGSISTSNGTIGDQAAVNPGDGTYSEIGVWSQLKF